MRARAGGCHRLAGPRLRRRMPGHRAICTPGSRPLATVRDESNPARRRSSGHDIARHRVFAASHMGCLSLRESSSMESPCLCRNVAGWDDAVLRGTGDSTIFFLNSHEGVMAVTGTAPRCPPWGETVSSGDPETEGSFPGGKSGGRCRPSPRRRSRRTRSHC